MENDNQKWEVHLLMDMFKHHYNLLFKGVILFFVIIGGVSSVIVTKWNQPENTVLLGWLFLINACLTLVPWFVFNIGLSWITKIEERVNTLLGTLGCHSFPFISGSGVLIVLKYLSIALCAINVFFAVLYMGVSIKLW